MIDLLCVRILGGTESDESYAEGLSLKATSVADFFVDLAHPFERLLNSDGLHGKK
jgi:hypothetical protein